MWKNSIAVASPSDINVAAPLKGSITENIRNAAALGFDAVQFTINRPAEFALAEALAALAECRMKASGSLREAPTRSTKYASGTRTRKSAWPQLRE